MTSAQRVLASLPSCTSYPFPALNSLVIWNFRRDFFSLFSVILEEGSSGWRWQRGPSRITHLPVFSQHPAVVLAVYLTPHHATSPAPPAQQQGTRLALLLLGDQVPEHLELSVGRWQQDGALRWSRGLDSVPLGPGNNKKGEELKDDFQSQK